MTQVAFSVVKPASGLTIVLHIRQDMQVPLTEVVLKGDTLKFNFAPTIPCTLTRQVNQSFLGLCDEEGGDEAKVTVRMVPPAR